MRWIWLLLVIPTIAHASVLDGYKRIYSNECARIGGNYGILIGEVSVQYRSQLDLIERQFQSAGDLQGVLAVRKAKSEKLKVVDNTAIGQVQALQKKKLVQACRLVAERNKELTTLKRKYVRSLQILQTSLTRKGQINQALKVAGVISMFAPTNCLALSPAKSPPQPKRTAVKQREVTLYVTGAYRFSLYVNGDPVTEQHRYDVCTKSITLKDGDVISGYAGEVRKGKHKHIAIYVGLFDDNDKTWLTTSTTGWKGLVDKQPEGDWKQSGFDDGKWKSLKKKGNLDSKIKGYQVNLKGTARGLDGQHFYFRKVVALKDFR